MPRVLALATAACLCAAAAFPSRASRAEGLPRASRAEGGAEAPASLPSPDVPAEVTLDDALRLAAKLSPELWARAAEVDEARGRHVQARTPTFNPELSITAAERRAPDGASTDRGVELSQEIELGGKRRRRAAVAEAEVAAAEARLERAAQALAARVELAFADALRTRELVRIEETDVELTGASAEVARKRLAAGAGTNMEVNLAVATNARAERRRQRAVAASEAARFVLAEAIGIPASESPAPLGELTPPAPVDLELESLLELARARRSDLEALRHDLQAAGERVRLARAEGAPNLRLGLFHEREERADEITGVSVGVGIPIFNRNRGATLEAEAGALRARWEALALERTIEREVAEAWAGLRAAQAASGRFVEAVVGSFEDNLRLLRRSFEAGKIGVSEVLLFRREFLDAEREAVEARSDARRARVIVEFAAGTLELPDFQRAQGPAAEDLP